MVFRRVDIGERVSLEWPHGFSARLLDGRAELVYPNGVVLARERDVISNLTGAAAGNGDIHICFGPASRPQVDHEP